MKKDTVAIVFTGGTISMTIDPRIGAAIPTLSGEQIMSMVTNIDKIANIKVFNFSEIPGPHVTPEILIKLKSQVEKLLADETITGVVVTHGTDSLEETAYFLDLAIESEKPVIVVGAMRSSSELGYDGPSNLAAAVCTAVSEKARNKGVLIVLNNEVNTAFESTKTNTLSLGTFKSLTYGPLGVIDNDKLIIHRNITPGQHIKTDTIESDVDLIKCVLGMDSKLLKFCVDSGSKGIVIEAMGRGNIPPKMVEGVQYAIDRNIPVVIVSRCPAGRVLDTYGYEGAGYALRKMGCIFGGELNGQKARIKLMLALGLTSNIDEIRNIFEKDEYYN
ncbi:L-asparaginase AnsA [Peptoclostridium acidaminophilum DSM 3953]|uniref:asparaginase n=1 Tax=Peptoclostridium acidaminophilum DSM 3953 TaxID=1286171 RepID=W8T3A2_PEPAC|nr:asparaginase [Peptoclostridium acidaminophilum]AHM56234.1 L-asparaginase AnsA [Peptoclostridium acidaminophilum DSM 3953]